MRVHYFYKRDYHGAWFAIKLEAIMEENAYSQARQKKEKSFTYLEQLRCHINRDLNRFHSSDFKIDFGKDSCYGHSARSVSELYKSKLDKSNSLESYTLITRAQYERLRKLAFAVYDKCRFMNFDLVNQKQIYSITKMDSNN